MARKNQLNSSLTFRASETSRLSGSVSDKNLSDTGECTSAVHRCGQGGHGKGQGRFNVFVGPRQRGTWGRSLQATEEGPPASREISIAASLHFALASCQCCHLNTSTT